MQCVLYSAFAHLKRRWSDSGDRPLGVVVSRQGEYLIIDKRRRPQRQRQQQRRWDNGGERTAARQRRQDNGGKTTAARQQRQWRRKKPAADLVISILFIYICVCFLVIFAVLWSYLFPAVLCYFIVLRKKIYFWGAPGYVSFLKRICVNSQKLTQKLKNLIFSLSVKFKG